jgi:hypothetical protein
MPKIEQFLVELPQITQVGETIVVKRISLKKQSVIIFEYIVTAVQFDASRESNNSPYAIVKAFLMH